jgi:hypothetical protein
MPLHSTSPDPPDVPELHLNTGQRLCYDTRGEEVPCPGSGQDAEEGPGVPWPEPRFEILGDDTVLDRLTELEWTRKGNFSGWPTDWPAAFDLVGRMNAEGFAGRRDWRLPNRRELRSLISHQTRDPALPRSHPFTDVFLGWYWTSTTAAINPAFAWYVHMEGGRMFYGGKREEKLVWPVRGRGNGVLPSTGQGECFDPGGRRVDCVGTGQDGELRLGAPWPEPRFRPEGEAVLDRLTGLTWSRSADLARRWTTWDEAFEVVERMNAGGFEDRTTWRLPTINELESLVDASRHTPALPANHPFRDVEEAYWSSTSSAFEPDWSMALYMYKGAVGVGQKKDENFSVWAVCREG